MRPENRPCHRSCPVHAWLPAAARYTILAPRAGFSRDEDGFLLPLVATSRRSLFALLDGAGVDDHRAFAGKEPGVAGLGIETEHYAGLADGVDEVLEHPGGAVVPHRHRCRLRRDARAAVNGQGVVPEVERVHVD